MNDLLTQGTGLDTFGNTGDTRIPHQHTKTQNFINSSGTGYKQTGNEPIRLSSNATGNPFLNTGIDIKVLHNSKCHKSILLILGMDLVTLNLNNTSNTNNNNNNHVMVMMAQV